MAARSASHVRVGLIAACLFLVGAPPRAGLAQESAAEPPVTAPAREESSPWSLDPSGTVVTRPDGAIDYFYTPRFRGAARVRDQLLASGYALAEEVILLPAYNLLILRATRARVDALRRFCHQFIDVAPAQVYLETEIAEVQYTRQFEFGFEGAFSQAHEHTWFRGFGVTFNPDSWLAFETRRNAGSLAPFTGVVSEFQTLDNTVTEDGKVGLGFTGARLASDAPAALRTVALASHVEILSRPRVLVQEGMTAEMEAGDRVPIQRVNINPGGAVSITFVEEAVTTKLRITADTIGEDAVHMRIEAEFADIVDFTDPNVSGGIAQPIIVRRKINTQAALRDRQTFIIGGLYSEEHVVASSGIPLLSDIPIIGQLFKSHRRERIRKEVVFFLTPTILKDHPGAVIVGEDEASPDQGE